MRRHILLMLMLTAAALLAGALMVPGTREQWTMLVRDGRDAEALRILDANYQAGKLDADAELNLYRILMSFAEIHRATRVVERLVAERPDDMMAVALLARHYADLQNRRGEIGALKRLFELSPSRETAQRLLALYRLESAFDAEEDLLRELLAEDLIGAPDAERLGLMLAASGDFTGARDALLHFDQIANPERMIGRLALFDILVRLGDKKTALAKAAAWIPNWRKTGGHRAVGADLPAARLVRMMMAVNEPEAMEIVCAAQRIEGMTGGRRLPAACRRAEPTAAAENAAENLGQ